LLTARVETQTDLLVTARAAYRGGDFETSYAAFSRAGAVGPLTIDDLDAMAMAAARLGHGREAMRVGELVYVRLTRTDPNAAAGKAVELGSAWLSRGEWVIGQSWIRRARGLLAGASESPTLAKLAYLETVVAVLSEDVDLAAERSAVLREMPLRGTQPEVAGEAYYQLGEVRRRRGDVDGAFAAYARAHALGVVPQPGEALLRCALGDVDTARAEVQAAIASTKPNALPRLLRGAIQIALAGGDLDEAEHYLRELESADAADNLLRGTVLVRRGRYREALTVLQAALRESGYEAAEVYEWMAQARRGFAASG
jgi:tetratricopeptide (TPR) repeat protein